MNLALMAVFRSQADKLLNKGDTRGAKAKLSRIGQYMVPLNIILGIVAIYMGVFLRNAY